MEHIADVDQRKKLRSQINANYYALQASYYKALVEDLSATDDDVEAAYTAAVNCKSAVIQANQDARDLAERVGRVSELSQAAADLLKSASTSK